MAGNVAKGAKEKGRSTWDRPWFALTRVVRIGCNSERLSRALLLLLRAVLLHLRSGEQACQSTEGAIGESLLGFTIFDLGVGGLCRLLVGRPGLGPVRLTLLDELIAFGNQIIGPGLGHLADGIQIRPGGFENRIEIVGIEEAGSGTQDPCYDVRHCVSSLPGLLIVGPSYVESRCDSPTHTVYTIGPKLSTLASHGLNVERM